MKKRQHLFIYINNTRKILNEKNDNSVNIYFLYYRCIYNVDIIKKLSMLQRI